MEIPVGLESQNKFTVEEKHIAKALGSGGLDVFSTPSMIAFMENIALTMVRPYLPNGHDSVGTMINAKHLKALPVGATVICKGTVTAVDGNKISYSIFCVDDNGNEIGTAEHERFVVDVERFLGKLKE